MATLNAFFAVAGHQSVTVYVGIPFSAVCIEAATVSFRALSLVILFVYCDGA
jgi:hypothetical protein